MSLSRPRSQQVDGHTARKRFGQNFLTNQAVISQIVAAIAPEPGQNLVEIGPGLGALTEPVLARCKRLSVVELDFDLLPRLLQRLAPLGELLGHQADALEFDFSSLATAGPLRVIGNLPYNISTPILFHLLSQRQHIADMHFMLQKEVIERMASPPGSREYGRLSVMVQYSCQVEHLFNVGPGAFSPPPKVDSAIVRLTPCQPELPAEDEALFAQLVSLAFNQRRKTIRNVWREYLQPDEFQALGLSAEQRPETLKPEEFVRVSNFVVQKRKESA